MAGVAAAVCPDPCVLFWTMDTWFALAEPTVYALVRGVSGGMTTTFFLHAARTLAVIIEVRTWI